MSRLGGRRARGQRAAAAEQVHAGASDMRWLCAPPRRRPQPPPPPPDVLLTLGRAARGQWWLRGHGVRTDNLNFELLVDTEDLIDYRRLRRLVLRECGILLSEMDWRFAWLRFLNEIMRPMRECENGPDKQWGPLYEYAERS